MSDGSTAKLYPGSTFSMQNIRVQSNFTLYLFFTYDVYIQSIDLDKRKSDQFALLPFDLYDNEINPAKNPAKKHDIPFSFLNIRLLEQNTIF